MNKYQQELEKAVVKKERVFVADTARVLGKVELDDDVSVWYGAVLRADFDKIYIGKRTNVQEGVFMHVDFGKPVVIGEDNIIGHGAMIHGAIIGNYNLIGMRATILNGARIGNGCIIGAHALVTENMVVPDGSMVLGTPGKILAVKSLEEVKKYVQFGVDEYLHEAARYLAGEQ